MEFLDDLKHHSESAQTKAKTSSSTSNNYSDNVGNLTCQTEVHQMVKKPSNKKLQVIPLPLKKIKIDCSKKLNLSSRNMTKNSSTNNYNLTTNVHKIYSNKNIMRPLRLSPSPKKPNILEILNLQLGNKTQTTKTLNKSVSGSSIKGVKKSCRNVGLNISHNNSVHKVKINLNQK